MTTVHPESQYAGTAAPAAAAGPVTIATYPTYPQAEAAVDRLSDSGFPVAGVAIVGRDISTVELVTGRLTVGRAALTGAGGGAWMGLFVGLLLGLFLPGGVGWFALIVSALVIGAVFGAVLGAVGQAATGGRRDFDSTQTLRAASYDVTVDGYRADEALRVLGGQQIAR
jgi:hypothetical protein